MENKLELKHIACYLPFGLQVKFTRKIYPRKIDYQILTINTLRLCEEAPSKFSIKPLLRPLSDLYKEIDGEVGIVEIAKILSGTIHIDSINGACKNLSYFRCTFEDGIEELIINERCEGWYRSYFDKNQPNTGRNIIDQFEVFTYLFSHHYDVFSLIDKGLAIDINSISHE